MKKKNSKRHTYYDPKKTKVALHPQEPKEMMAESSGTDIATILTLAFGPDWRFTKAWDHPRQALRPSEATLRDAAICRVPDVARVHQHVVYRKAALAAV